ncbi:VOC family protein [Streptomyces sp. NPDC057654]|uniref:VOC family protein n=1 Tax=Streptomyces sp. NPDC057654 TaxID=3346196 RepID=UPI00368C4C7F
MTPRFDLIGLVTPDLPASLAFYRRLGLDIPADADGQPHVEAALPGGLRMAWDALETIRSFQPGFDLPQGPGRVSLAFACDGPAEVDKVYGELVGAGYEGEKAPWDAPWGMRYAIVHDPDGNSVDLFAALPAG